MTPEDEWLESSLRADRERRAFQEMFKDAPRNYPVNFPRYRDWVILAVVLGFLIYGAFFK